MEKYQPPGFDFLFAGLKRLAVDWKLAELEDDEPAGSEVAVAVGVEQLGPVGEPQPDTQDIQLNVFTETKNPNKSCT